MVAASLQTLLPLTLAENLTQMELPVDSISKGR